MPPEIKFLSANDIPNLLILQNNILKSIKDKTFFYPATSDELKQIITQTGYAVGIYNDKLLIGYATAIYCALDYSASASFNVPPNYVANVAILDDVAILEQYRGHKYQLYLWNYITSKLNSEIKYVLTSIHPKNYASLNNAKKFNMKILCTKILYCDYPRYILYKKLYGTVNK